MTTVCNANGVWLALLLVIAFNSPSTCLSNQLLGYVWY